MTKAGKVKQQTPKVDRTGVNGTPKKPPRMRFRELYVRRFQKNKFAGQPDSINAKRNSFKK